MTELVIDVVCDVRSLYAGRVIPLFLISLMASAVRGRAARRSDRARDFLGARFDRRPIDGENRGRIVFL